MSSRRSTRKSLNNTYKNTTHATKRQLQPPNTTTLMNYVADAQPEAGGGGSAGKGVPGTYAEHSVCCVVCVCRAIVSQDKIAQMEKAAHSREQELRAELKLEKNKVYKAAVLSV